ncbi:MAG: helix-turn-helix domain-containing protein [Candidatus Dormibacteria bacterium]
MRTSIDGVALRRELARRGMDQAELANAAGLSAATVSHAAMGHPVNLSTIQAIARVLSRTPVLRGTEAICQPAGGAATR